MILRRLMMVFAMALLIGTTSAVQAAVCCSTCSNNYVDCCSNCANQCLVHDACYTTCHNIELHCQSTCNPACELDHAKDTQQVVVEDESTKSCHLALN